MKQQTMMSKVSYNNTTTNYNIDAIIMHIINGPAVLKIIHLFNIFHSIKNKRQSCKKKKKITITIIKKGAVNREVSGHNSILPLHEDRFLQPQK